MGKKMEPGKDFLIRPICAEDANQLIALRRKPGVFESKMGLPSDRLELTEAFYESLGESSFHFVAEIAESGGEKRLIGMAGMGINPGLRARHSAGLGIIVDPVFQGRGVGRALMETLINLADQWLMLVRLELDVLCDNEHAIALYESLGFEKEGIKRKSVIRNGDYADTIWMARISKTR